MPKAIAAVPAGLAILVLALAGAGCGAGIASNGVARVGNTTITRAELDHLISIDATIAKNEELTKPENQQHTRPKNQTGASVIKPVTLEPPNYTNCVASELAAHRVEVEAVHNKDKTSVSLPNLLAVETTAFRESCRVEYDRYKEPDLTQLIYDNWILGEAAHQGIHATSAEIERELNMGKATPAKQKLLEAAGVTTADLLRNANVHLLERQLMTKISTELIAKAKSQGVPHSRIVAYYKQHLSKYERPEARDAQLLLTEGFSEAKRARDEIRAGKTFTSVADRVGNEPNSIGGASSTFELVKGGINTKYTMPGILSAKGKEILERAIFSAKEDVLTGPVKTPDAYYLFLIGKSTPKQPTVPLAQIEPQIKQRLSEKQIVRVAAFTQTLQARWKAKTDCAPNFVIPYCSQYRPPKQTSKTSTPTPAQKQRAEERAVVEETKSHPRSLVQPLATIKLNSRAIVQRGRVSRARGNPSRITANYTCDGANVSPPLEWGNGPRGAAELLLVVGEAIRGQASLRIIWTVAGLNPSIQKGIPAGSIPVGAIVGRNSAGRTGWPGICPPPGVEREYYFQIYALRTKLHLQPGFNLQSVGRQIQLQEAAHHTKTADLVAKNKLIASYERR